MVDNALNNLARELRLKGSDTKQVSNPKCKNAQQNVHPPHRFGECPAYDGGTRREKVVH
jgi:hypothetical protein